MDTPLSPDPVTDHRPDYLPAYLSNGVIGLRVREVPLRAGVAIVNGLAGVHPVARIACSPYVPYPLAGDLHLGDVALSDLPRGARFVEQVYDFSCGELHSRFAFAVEGQEARVEVLTFCSRTQPTLVLQETLVAVSGDGDVTLSAIVTPDDLAGRYLLRTTELPDADPWAVDGVLHWETLGRLATLGIAYTTEFQGADATRTRQQWGEQRPLATRYAFRAGAGQTYRLRQLAALVPSQLHRQPHLEAARLAAQGRALGFDALRAENRAAWAELWRGRVRLLGADRRWQALADAAFYYLQASVHHSSPASTAIFGLAQWPNYNYYYGHVMWDLETFAVPALLLTQPHAARAMLDYRSRCLSAAQANARLHGYRGLQFPWQSDPVHGDEETPPPDVAGAYEEHAGLSVAHAVAQYAHATGDRDFLRRQGWPILHGVAEWLTSRVTASPRGYEIRRAMGIAERQDLVDNDAYVNMLASVVLREAVACAARLGYDAPATWTAIAEGLVVPRDAHTGVILNHDGYMPDEEKGATPGALAGLFPVGYPVDGRVERATLAYYLDLADRYIGSPMLSALYGVWAARTGDRERAARLFEEGYARFVCDRFLNTHEYRADKFPDQPSAGPFFANLAGFLLGCLYGLSGVSIGPGEPASWCARPVVMPAGWDGVEVERLWVHGRPAHLLARHGEARARLDVAPGP